MAAAQHLFITGTDTDVGKTLVSTAILSYANQRGLQTIGFKPIAAGCELTPQGLRNDDALLLQHWASCELEYDIVNPLAYAPAIAPHIAAAQQHQSIDLQRVDSAYNRIKQHPCDLVIIEGAGGWHLPISKQLYFSAWVASHKLDVILVVGIKLGCLNHALLTAQVITYSGCRIVGWVANSLAPATEVDNAMIATLSAELPAPLIGEIPYLAQYSAKTDCLAKYLDLSAFLRQ